MAMDKERKQDIALMRYSAIAPLITGLKEDYPSLKAFFRDASAKGVTAPDGTLRHFAPVTIERWYRSYMRGGFETLLPAGRCDAGRPRRLDDELQEQIRHLKASYPRMSAAAILRQLEDNGSIGNGEVSQATVCRFLNQIEFQGRHAGGQDMRRYERPHINEVWCGDSSAGPYLKTQDGKKRRAFVIALIDDASRFITGIDVFFNDSFVNLMSVMKSAVAKYGRPKVFNFDNGSAYKNRQMELPAARIGSTLNYCRPYTPTAKAKIERWFRTMKDQWMSSLDASGFTTLDELRGSLFSYVHSYNQTSHASLKGKSPQERFFSEPEYIHRLTEQEIPGSFLLEAERRVSADSVVVIGHTEYEVDCRFAKQRITLRYTPDWKEVFIVEADGTLTPVRLLNKQENALVKREKVHLYQGGDAP